MTQHSPPDEPTALTPETLANRVWDSMTPKARTGLTLEELRRVAATLDLSSDQMPAPPALVIRRLMLCGVKRRPNRADEPFVYNQAFVPGVNILFIQDNSVGKSTVLKNIKFALTGDDQDQEGDVRPWIDEVRLVFTLGQTTFTTLHRRCTVLRTLLVGGEIGLDVPFESVEHEAERAYISATGASDAQTELERFFFQRLGLEPLSWTQPGGSGALSISSTSWLTYFQALFVRDDSDRYLLVDGKHNIGNQGGLILSMFMGLNLAEPLNVLAVTEQTAKKKAQEVTRRTEAEQAAANVQVEQLAEQEAAVHLRLQGLRQQVRERQRELSSSTLAQQLPDANAHLIALHSEQRTLEKQRGDLQDTIRRLRAQERRLREAAEFALHFSSYEVELCPNCEHDVDEAAVVREHTHHTCRLCGEDAQPADLEDIELLKTQADALRKDQDELEQQLSSIGLNLRRVADEVKTVEAVLARVRAQATLSVTSALPTDEEQAEMDQLAEAIGTFRAQQRLLHQQTSQAEAQVAEWHQAERAAVALRHHLAREGEQRNAPLLARLSELTQQAAQAIGAQSITDVTISAKGSVALKKNGQQVPFSRINNTGERLRVKLAFFLAMIRLSREAGYGRHPGLLLIDQPGSAEMVDDDFEALARVLRQVDAAHPEVQIICATARAGLQQATTPEKVYGPQNPPNAF